MSSLTYTLSDTHNKNVISSDNLVNWFLLGRKNTSFKREQRITTLKWMSAFKTILHNILIYKLLLKIQYSVQMNTSCPNVPDMRNPCFLPVPSLENFLWQKWERVSKKALWHCDTYQLQSQKVQDWTKTCMRPFLCVLQLTTTFSLETFVKSVCALLLIFMALKQQFQSRKIHNIHYMCVSMGRPLPCEQMQNSVPEWAHVTSNFTIKLVSDKVNKIHPFIKLANFFNRFRNLLFSVCLKSHFITTLLSEI